MFCVHLDKSREKCRAVVNTVMNLRVPYNAWNFMTSWGTVSFSITAKQSYIIQLPMWGVLQKVSGSSMRYKTELTGNKRSRTTLSITFLSLSSTSTLNIFHLLEVVYITFQSTPSGRDILWGVLYNKFRRPWMKKIVQSWCFQKRTMFVYNPSTEMAPVIYYYVSIFGKKSIVYLICYKLCLAWNLLLYVTNFGGN